MKGYSPAKLLLYLSVFVVGLGTLFATFILYKLDQTFAESKELARPARIEVTALIASNCSDCFDIENFTKVLKNQNVSIISEKSIDYSSEEGKNLIAQFGVTKVPTVILNGEVQKSNLADFVKTYGIIKNNSFVFTSTPPVYIDTASNNKVGNVSLTAIIDSSCEKCLYTSLVTEGLRKSGVIIGSENSVQASSTEGQSLITQYAITKIPTLILSNDISAYNQLNANWKNIGTVESDGMYITRNIAPPYRDLDTNQIVGLVDTLYLVDSSCTQCFDPNKTLNDILTRGLQVAINSERSIDINSSEGKTLVNKYKVTKVPAAIYSPEINSYTNLKGTWQQAGTIEADGFYIFRNAEILQGISYKDLVSGEVKTTQ